MKNFLLCLIFICCCAINLVSFDALLELDAQIARRANVNIVKNFNKIQLDREFSEFGYVYLEGIVVDIEYNDATPFAVKFYRPQNFGEDQKLNYSMVNKDNEEIGFFLRNSLSNEVYSVGSTLIKMDAIKEPYFGHFVFDFVIPEFSREINLATSYSGKLGITIVDL